MDFAQMPKRIIFSDCQLQSMRDKYESGLSARDIAPLFGCSYQTISTALKRIGVKIDSTTAIRAKAIGRPSAMKGTKWSNETRNKFIDSRRKSAESGIQWGGAIGSYTKERYEKIVAARKVKLSERKQEASEFGVSVDPVKIRSVCKRFVRRVLRAKGVKKNGTSASYLGYSHVDLINWLGDKPCLDAHVDHIVPISHFISIGITDPAVINALPNLRWLGAEENRRKSAKVPENAPDIVRICIADASRRKGLRP